MGGKEISLIGTGITLGIVHVLTGPDHLSALATLSVNVNDFQQAFFLGIRWGLGHSTGLLVVGIILIAWDAGSSKTIHVPDEVSLVFDSLMGIFMLLLGAHGIRRAWEKRSEKVYPSDYGSRILPSSCQQHYGGLSSTTATHTTTDIESYQNQHTTTQHLLSERQQQGVEDSPPPAYGAIHGHAHSHPHIHHHGSVRDDSDEEANDDESSSSCWSHHCSRRHGISVRTLAVCAGIVHGLAGPGGVLGVIPAVQLHSGKLATIYLASFCLSSTLTMGIFAIVYGTCSNRLGGGGSLIVRQGQQQDDSSPTTMDPPLVVATKNTKCEFLIECVSAFLSILVGITWLTLLSIGKLDDIFP